MRKLGSIGARLSTWVAMAAVSVGCSSKEDQAGGNSGTGGGPAIDATHLGGGQAPTGDDVTFSAQPDGGCSINVGSSPCSAVAYEDEAIPLDIYIMFDQTGSMCNCVDPPANSSPCPDPNCRKTRIQAIREATGQFLLDPKSAGIGVGIGYFGQLPLGSTSCDPKTYESPSVPVGILPAQAAAITTSLEAVTPIGETPTAAAIRGACTYAKSWRQAHPSHQVIILLVTDGEPKAPVTCPNGTGTCCPTLDDAVKAATECRTGSPGIRTFVLGVGPFLDNLAQIAMAGGSNKAYLVSGADVAAEVLAALNQIRGDASIPCELSVPPPPPGQSLALDKVNIAYANSVCQGTIFYYVKSASSCTDQGGWYYDDPAAPQKVELCPSSCDLVSVPGGQLMYSVGCNTVVSVY